MNFERPPGQTSGLLYADFIFQARDNRGAFPSDPN